MTVSSPRARISHGVSRDRVRLEIRRARRPFFVLVGLIVLALGAAAYIVGNLRSSLPWQSPYRVRVAVDNAKGIVPGKQEVRISGVAVGRIQQVDLRDGRPVLTISMERRYAPLYRDARLRLRPKTPLDDLYLDIDQRGHLRAGKLADSQLLEAQRTRTPVDIGEVLDALDADTRTRVGEAIDELGRALPDHGDQLRAALVELSPFLRAAQRLSRELAVRRGHTRRLVHNLRVMTGELARRQGQLSQLVRGGAASFTELGRADVPLAQTLSELPPTLRQLESTFATVRATAGQLDPALDALLPTATALPAGLDALRSFSVDARPALATLRRALPRLTPFVHALRPTAIDLAQAFGQLRPQAPRLDRITAAVVPCELAVAKFFENTISVTKFYDSQTAFPRGQAVLGLSSLGGQLRDAVQEGGRSCAPGGPRR